LPRLTRGFSKTESVPPPGEETGPVGQRWKVKEDQGPLLLCEVQAILPEKRLYLIFEVDVRVFQDVEYP
jgi:hypothetical protein